MQSNLNRARREAFRARNLPVPLLPQYRHTPRISVQHDAPRQYLSCGTIAMLTTLHLLLGKRRPHDLHAIYISREKMLHLHEALLAWLITGTSPVLWEIDCLHQDVVPPVAHIGPYTHQSVAATINGPNGAYWRPSYPAQTQVEAPGPTAPMRQLSKDRSSQETVTPLTHGPSPAPPHDPSPHHTGG